MISIIDVVHQSYDDLERDYSELLGPATCKPDSNASTELPVEPIQEPPPRSTSEFNQTETVPPSSSQATGSENASSQNKSFVPLTDVADDLLKDITIIHVSDAESEEYLRKLLSPDGRLDPIALNLLKKFQTQVKSVVIEANYNDPEHHASVNRFHVRSDRELNRRCIRLHLFGCSIELQTLISMSSVEKAAYLGFIVLRPLAMNRFGRSFFSPLLCITDSPLPTYITCAAQHSVSLLGNDIAFPAVAWMQSDRISSSCATVAIWVSNIHMSQYFPSEFRYFSNAEITDLAHRYDLPGKKIPAQGLTMQQMQCALHGMGYNSEVHQPPTAREAKRLIDFYSAAGIPVILIVQYSDGSSDAVTLVGYSLKIGSKQAVFDRLPINEEGLKATRFSRPSDMIEQFIVQDNSLGPFTRIEICDWEEVQHSPRGKGKVHGPSCMVHFSSSDHHAELLHLIVPLTAEVALSGTAAEENAIAVYASLCDNSIHVPPELLSMRTFLQRSSLLKSFWAEAIDMPVELGRDLRLHLMPKWVWVTEFGEFQTCVDTGRIFGQVIQDARAHPGDHDESHVIAYHVPSTCYFVRPDGNTIQTTNHYSTLPSFRNNYRRKH